MLAKNTTLNRSIYLLICLLCITLMSSSLHAQPLEMRGEFKQGGLITGRVNPKTKIYLDGEELRVTPNGQFVFGFGRDAKPDSTIVLVNGDEKQSVKLDIRQREYPTQYIEGVPQRTVTPPKEKLERIKAETALVKQARKTDTSLEHFLTRFKPPMEAPITGVYGSQRVYNGVPKRPHFGVDYAAPVGTPVYAPADGVVTLTHDDMYYSGGTLIMDHGYGVSSTFIHLSEVIVNKGDYVKQGDMIAKVGQGGRSTGPHLDWRVNWFDVRIDPLLVLKLAESYK